VPVVVIADTKENLKNRWGNYIAGEMEALYHENLQQQFKMTKYISEMQAKCESIIDETADQ
jgi:hypothetical protein